MSHSHVETFYTFAHFKNSNKDERILFQKKKEKTKKQNKNNHLRCVLRK